jgi:hypothetical protein
MRETVLIIMAVVAIVCYFKVGNRIDNTKPTGLAYTALLLLIFGFSLMLNFTLIAQNDKLEEKVKNKCPEYEKVENVYILKKK